MADVVKACRQSPFGEWVIVYFDANKTTPEKLLERLKKNGCDKATRVSPAAAEKDKKKISVSNPIAVPGDWFEIVAEGYDKAPAVAAPDGWTVAVRGAKRIVVQAPPSAKAGKFTLQVGDLEIEVELVPQIK